MVKIFFKLLNHISFLFSKTAWFLGLAIKLILNYSYSIILTKQLNKKPWIEIKMRTQRLILKLFMCLSL